jgi:two-component system NtrC family sensor kinase
MRSIATKLVLSFLFVVIALSVVFTLVGIQFIGNRIEAEAQEKVRTDLNSAREIYLHHLDEIYNVVRLTANRFVFKDALLSGSIERVAGELTRIRTQERLDTLTVLDKSGIVLLRANNPGLFGDSQSQDEIVREVLRTREPLAATSVVPASELRKESPLLVERAYFKFVEVPRARPRPETEETAGLMLRAAAPVFDYQGNLIGVIRGGVLLNRRFEIVDKIKQTVFQDVKYKGMDIGTATLFLDDVRISTNVRNKDGSRAIGTRLAEDVYQQVVLEGKPWIGRAFVVNNWYITAYEPIRNVGGKVIGILYVGILEQRYTDLKQRSILLFMSLTLLAALASMTFAYFISRRISGPVRQLVAASKEVAAGNLDAKVKVNSQDELRQLSDSFNSMAAALKRRDEQLKEFARNKIMESERLAIVGQLAAGVAHELNNPLQGIVSYSYLLLEKLPPGDAMRTSVEKIVKQANRCTVIIRGLLDFSRQRKPQKRVANVNALLQECFSLVEGQALFHNIHIVKDLRADLPNAVLDPSEVQQVFMNMIINAAEAMDGEGQLTVATRLDPETDCVEVHINDTGHGISPENIDKLFNPFFTTKEVGHGTGLGLAISFGIVKEHGGTISVESEVGKGTTFVVRLPVAAEVKA